MGINGFLWEFKKYFPFDKIILHLVCLIFIQQHLEKKFTI